MITLERKGKERGWNESNTEEKEEKGTTGKRRKESKRWLMF